MKRKKSDKLFYVFTVLVVLLSMRLSSTALDYRENKGSDNTELRTEYIATTDSDSPNEIEVIDIPELEKLIREVDSDIRVINFWATWCGPCVKELPYFEKISLDPRFDNVEIFLVSLDFIQDLDTRVKNFVNKKNIQSTVLLMKNTDYNSWIDKVDSSWSGAIPATLIIDAESGKRKFIEKTLEEGELEKILSEF
jgi:thiol-disulfide isomerase/thioredoxin